MELVCPKPRHSLGDVSAACDRRGVKQAPPSNGFLQVHEERPRQEETLCGNERRLCIEDTKAFLAGAEVLLREEISFR